MPSQPSLYLAFLWHQHQPFYKNPSTGVYEMPWARLHAVKDYYDLAALLDVFPKIKFNINLVPSLMTQLDDYAAGGGRDRIMELTLVNASNLSREQSVEILDNFFMANPATMINPYPRYAELYRKRGRDVSREALLRAAARFKPQDFLDLQLWFNLAWTDPYWRRADPLVGRLFEKGKNYSEDDKALLIKKHLEICGAVVPKHRQLQNDGRAEISVTPFYHPILPLLCDTDAARISIPSAKLPLNRFRRPEDARAQIEKAAVYYEQKFGVRPRGFWPSEGSVSEEALGLLAAAGARWAATDEEVLFRSLNGRAVARGSSRADIYEPWRFECKEGHIDLFFRDHALSDAIGFVYSGRSASAAADDFMKRLENIKKTHRPASGRPPIVSVILDGENCWEYYPSDGEEFLSELLGRLSSDDGVETVTYSDYLRRFPPARRLERAHAGSWINANFAIWIGHDEDNASWDALSAAREFIADYLRKNPAASSSEAFGTAMEHLMAAEGSDWNWWYGDDHGSLQDALFDSLYRAHLKKIYESLGAAPPENLNIPIKTSRRSSERVTEPSDFLNVKVDGLATNYYEWLSAGFYRTGLTGGSMHQVASDIKAVYYGFDLERLCVRIDAEILKNAGSKAVTEFRLIFSEPSGINVKVVFGGSGGKASKFIIEKEGKTIFDAADAGLGANQGAQPEAAAIKVAEIAVPFRILGTKEGENIAFWTALFDSKGVETERWPRQNIFSVKHPSPAEFRHIWSV